MKTISITEALAELKVIQKRIENQESNVFQYTLRNESMKDPLQAQGGSVSYIASRIQSINDLRENLIQIRRAIQSANEHNAITIGTTTRTIADWLVWRRDVASSEINFYKRIKDGIDKARIAAVQRGHTATSPDQAKPEDIIVNIDEVVLNNTIDSLTTAYERLDGQLSLKNATIMIELPD